MDESQHDQEQMCSEKQVQTTREVETRAAPKDRSQASVQFKGKDRGEEIREEDRSRENEIRASRMRQARATTMEAQSWGGAGAGAAGLRPQSKGRRKSGRCQLYKMRVLISEISNLVGEV